MVRRRRRPMWVVAVVEPWRRTTSDVIDVHDTQVAAPDGKRSPLADEASSRWVTRCAGHNELRSWTTKRDAKAAAVKPWLWCSGCESENVNLVELAHRSRQVLERTGHVPTNRTLPYSTPGWIVREWQDEQGLITRAGEPAENGRSLWFPDEGRSS